MDLFQILTLLCFYGPAPVAALMAGWQALQCKSPWQAFFVGLVGTIALAVVFGIAVDFFQIGHWTFPAGEVWQTNFMVSPFLALPLAFFCAFWASRRNKAEPGGMT